MHLYLHIPFCRKACHYCDFHFSTDTAYADRMVNAICTELVLRKSEIKEPLETIYFGGGTPSVLTKNQVEKIFRVIHKGSEIDISLAKGKTIEEDLKLRDFTINAIGYDIQNKKIIDPFNGISDLKNRVLKAVDKNKF